MKLTKLCLFFIFSLIFSLVLQKPAYAAILGKPEPGENPQCTTGDLKNCEFLGDQKCFTGYNCLRKDDCSNDQCSQCFFCGTWNWGGTSTSPLKKFQQVVDNDDTNGTMSRQSYVNGVLGDLLNGGTTELVGKLGNNPSDSASSGAAGGLAVLIGAMAGRPPVSSKEYFADLGSSLGFAKPVYAAGMGFQALTPVLPIWRAFRNISYIAFVAIFVIIGFMIMFRAKINSQTAISIEAALPRVVITLLLVTFSYAIAGLMIDLIYIVLYFIVGVFSTAGLITNPDWIIKRFTTQGLFALVYDKGANVLMWGPAEAVKGIIEGAQANVLGWLTGQIFYLILAIVLVFTLFKTFFALLTSYISIILSVIFAPFQLLTNALPGNDTVMNWIKTLLANAIVFPITALLFLLAAVLIGVEPGNVNPCGEGTANPWCIGAGYGFKADPNAAVWTPPLLRLDSIKNASDYSSLGANPILALIGLGMIMMIPQILAMVKKSLKVEGGFAGGVVGGLMAGPKMIAAVPQTYVNVARDWSYIRHPSGGQGGSGTAAVKQGNPQGEEPGRG